MKRIVVILTLLWASQAYATSIRFRDLTNLVADADHILIARIDKAEMVDGTGQPVADPQAATGPGSTNEIRLHVSVVTNGVLKSNLKPPRKLVIPIWKKWIHRLSQWKKREGQTCIFLLKGDDYRYVYYGGFIRDLKDKPKIEALLKKREPQNKELKSDALGRAP